MVRIRRSGFSLVEVLFGIFLAGLCATILAATMPVAQQSRERANLNNAAVSLAQRQMEAVRGLGYANLTPDRLLANGVIESATPIATNTFSFNGVGAATANSPALLLPRGQGRITIEQAGLDLRRVVIELRWDDRGRQRTFRLGSLVANL